MKKILFLLVLLVTSVGISYAQNYGSYTGTMDEITMNGKEYDSQSGQSFTLTTTKLTGTVGKIGKMPGTINLNVVDIKIDSDGKIAATPNTTCGQLVVAGMFPINLTLSSLVGDVNDNRLEFTLECTGKFISTEYVAHIHFVGTK